MCLSFDSATSTDSPASFRLSMISTMRWAKDRRDALGRLIEHQQLGPDHQCAGKSDEFLLTAGKLRGAAIAELLHLRHQLVDPFQPFLGFFNLRGPGRQHDVFFRRQLWHQTAVFRHEADPHMRPLMRRRLDKIGAVELHLAILGI